MTTTMSKAEEVRQDAEVIEAPPPTYEASIVAKSELYSEHDYHIIETGPSTSEEKRPTIASPTLVDVKKPISPPPEFFSHDKSDPTFSQAIVPYQQPEEEEEEETPPTLPRRPSSISTSSIPLTYTLAWKRAILERRPYFDCPALSISPSNGLPLPPSSPGLPSTCRWQLSYEKKYFARLYRHAREQGSGDIPYRQIAEIQYPDFMWPNGGVKIKFEPHEEEIARRGSRHVSRTDKMMVRSGWWSAQYGMDLPVLGGGRVDWVNVGSEVKNKFGEMITSESSPDVGIERGVGKQKNMSRAERLGLKPGQVHLVTLGEVWEDAKRAYASYTAPKNNTTIASRTPDSSSSSGWSPYPVQHLIEEHSGRILAIFTRSKPLSKEAGKLEILPPSQDIQIPLPEYIEGIVIAAAAMVGMKDRMGLVSGLCDLFQPGSRTAAVSQKREKAIPCEH